MFAMLIVAACSDDAATTSPVETDGGSTEGGDAGSGTGEIKPPRRFFVTQARPTGAMGGPAGADGLCSTEAASAGLAGTFVAWITTTTSAAVERLPKDVAFMRTDGKILFESRADIEAGKGPAFGITLDATGKELSGATFVWTGGDGLTKASAEPCAGWTTNIVGVTAAAGVFGGTGKEWTASAAAQDCGQAFPILCFER